MAKIIFYFWRATSIFTISIFLWFAISVGFFDFVVEIPKHLIEKRRSYFTVDQVKMYWGIEKFNSKDWKSQKARAQQAVDLILNNKLIGYSRDQVIDLLGQRDGTYVSQDGELSYLILDHTFFVPSRGNYGSNWSLFLKMDSNDRVVGAQFIRACCQTFSP